MASNFPALSLPSEKPPFLEQALAVQPPVLGLFVKVELAAARHMVAGFAQHGVEGRLVQGIVVAVVGYAGPVILLARGEAGAGRRAERRGDDRALEGHAAAGQRGQMRRADVQVGVESGPVEAVLIGEEEKRMLGRRR